MTSTQRFVNAKIELQKERAIALWLRICQDSKKSGDKKSTVASGAKKLVITADLEKRVMHDLRQGLVPPIFHGLVMRKKSPFPETHVLSAKTVEAGTVLEDKSIHELSRSGNNHDVFFSSVKSKGGLLTANQKLLDWTGITWTFDDEETQNFAELVNAKATMVGEDVEETKLRNSTFGMRPKTDRALLTRHLSRGVVSDCFGSTTLGSSLAIMGATGMGKSWTLVYALQQALLYDGACVIFFQQKTGVAYLCLRKDHHIYVWTTKVRQSRVNSILFRSEEVLVLLDPVEEEKGGASYMEGSRMLIFAASNDDRHFANYIKMSEFETLRYLSPWSEEELRVGLPRMQPNIDVELALMRAKSVGMLPRYLLDEKAYNRRNELLDAAVEKLSKDTVKLELALKYWETEIGKKISTIPGTVFARLQEPNDDVRLPGYMYDGQFGVLYDEPELRIMSDKVKNQLLMKNSKTHYHEER
jgi:hypothetical protein